jgi:hypothetical protein
VRQNRRLAMLILTIQMAKDACPESMKTFHWINAIHPNFPR